MCVCLFVCLSASMSLFSLSEYLTSKDIDCRAKAIELLSELLKQSKFDLVSDEGVFILAVDQWLLHCAPYSSTLPSGVLY